MDDGSASGVSARGLTLTTATPTATTKDTHDHVDSTSAGANSANSNNNNNNNNALYQSNLSDCQNVSSSGGGTARGGSSELNATSAVTPAITHIKQSPSPMSSGAAEATTVGLQQQQQQQRHQQQHHHRQSDEVLFDATTASAIVTHPHSTIAALDMQHQQQQAHAQQHHQLQQQQQQQHLQRLGSLSSISNTPATGATTAADTVAGSRGSGGAGVGHSVGGERPPPPPYSSSAAVMASKAFHAGSCAAHSMEAISGDEPPIATQTSRLTAYEQFLKLSAQEYATTTSDNVSVLNLSSIGKAVDSDLMLRHVNVAAVMAAAAVESGGAAEGSGVGVADGCEHN
ncbi:GATA zinc finger domain-containing protein 10-like [Anastrepha obliqua]|uniref:GATA zinc finger domain-containing protein 10-like n=1 Tax=Anastrepha obliqua TaxID=95512 RepID=UPI002409D65B|nr:GATA zinc finger domain-containing protein 10-like [Anastrepha obliqua]